MTANAHNSNGHRRVLIVVNHPLGGIRTYLLNNLPHIAKSGYVYTFLAPAGEAFTEFKHDVEDWPGVEFVEVPVKNRKHRLWTTVRRTLKTGRFELIHSQGLRAGTETALANLGRGIPHIMTLHDVIVPQNDVPGRLKWLKQFLASRLTRRIDMIVAVSNDCAENHLARFPAWNRGPCRIEVIHNGVDVERLCRSSIPTQELRQQIGADSKTVVAGFFGRFMPQKGFTVLLDALRLLAARGYKDRIRLVATDDPYGYGREYHTIVEADAALREMVKFVPPVADIGALLPQVDLLVMPSLWEACPLLPMEAMVLGVPVIGSDAIGLREVLRDTPSLMPCAGDSNSLAEAIARTMFRSLATESAMYKAIAMKRFGNQEPNHLLARVYKAIMATGKFPLH